MKEREAPRNLLLCRQYLDAVESGDIEFLQEWILHGRDVNVRLGEGWTALHYAVKRGHIEIVKCLLKTKEIDLNPTTFFGLSPLGIALQNKSNTMIQLLLQAGASRSTLRQEELMVAWTSNWISQDTSNMLLPSWSIVWHPTNHHRFSRDQRQKVALILQANLLAQQINSATNISLFNKIWKIMWNSNIFFNDETLSFKSINQVKWTYLPPPVIHHIFEYAMFLW